MMAGVLGYIEHVTEQNKLTRQNLARHASWLRQGKYIISPQRLDSYAFAQEKPEPKKIETGKQDFDEIFKTLDPKLYAKQHGN